MEAVGEFSLGEEGGAGREERGGLGGPWLQPRRATEHPQHPASSAALPPAARANNPLQIAVVGHVKATLPSPPSPPNTDPSCHRTCATLAELNVTPGCIYAAHPRRAVPPPGCTLGVSHALPHPWGTPTSPFLALGSAASPDPCSCVDTAAPGCAPECHAATRPPRCRSVPFAPSKHERSKHPPCFQIFGCLFFPPPPTPDSLSYRGCM